ncbi:MAG: NosD domain-containing protein, partial [Candidatus Thorarchaeota archaeon]
DNSEYGIYLWGSSNTNSIVQHNFCLNNTESGIYSYYAHNPSYINNTCNLNQKSGIHYEIGNDPIFTNNTCNRNTLHGIFLDSFGLTNHFVRNNTCGYNGDRGILALELWDGEIVGNICFNNTYGVTLMTSDSVTMTSNTLTGNDIGVSLDSSSDSNSFNWNAIRFCTVEDAQDDGTGNDFDYNYWSNYTGVDVNMDGFGDTPYFIGGTTVSQDSHPLILPPDRPPITWDETPTNQTILEIDDFNYDLDATALASIDVWKVNDTDNFYIDTMGVVRNATILNPDIFGMQVWVNDTYGNVLSAIFSITVLDATPPEWTITPGDQTIEYGYPLVCEFNASDLSGLDMWFVNDTAHFAIDQSGILRNATVILPGIYGCEVSVNDTLGNTKTTILIMTIQSSAPPTWVESPVDRIVEYNDIFSYNLDATDISGLGVWWINDTVNFAIDQEGTIINVTSLSVATYGIMVYVSDSLGNILNNAFQVRIQDTTPPDWIETPEDQFVEYGDTYVCDFNATDLSGIDDWWVDDTIRFTIDYAGRIRTVTILEPGIYGLQVWVSDIYGNELTVTFDVEIADTTPPEWIDDPIDQFLEFGESLSYRLEATDLSSINDWALNDTERFTISNNGLITNVASLEAGHYGLQVSVSDPYGNALTATFIVHVGAVTTTTSTTTTTTDPTTTSNDTASIQIEPLLLVAVGGGIVIVAVIAFIVLKRR